MSRTGVFVFTIAIDHENITWLGIVQCPVDDQVVTFSSKDRQYRSIERSITCNMVDKLQELEDNSLPAAGDVTIKVQYSTLNYKDALAITGKGSVVRKCPMVPVIDFAGIVEHSDNPSYGTGDLVLLNGWGGETHWGGLAARARVNGNWLIPIPAGITAEQAMAIGTAGYTAMLCVIALACTGCEFAP